MSRTIIAAEIGYKDASTSPNTTATLYMASEGFVTDNTDALPNEYFAGRLDGEVRYSIKLSTAFWGGESSVGIGAVEVINDDGGLDAWVDYEFGDQAIVLKEHTSGVSYDSATVWLNAIIERMDVVNEKRLRFLIRDPAAPLVKPITTAAYDSTTDADGVLKPIAFGQAELVNPVLVDEDTLQYAVSDAALQKIVTVYDQGVSVDFNPVTSGFKLIVAPTGKVTASVLTSGTGNDPALTVDETLYSVSGEGRSLQMFDDGLSPEVSLSHAFSDVSHSRASSGGGKYYFEMYIDNIRYQSGAYVGEGSFGSGNLGSVAAGIQSSAISNPQDLTNSGQYVFAIGNSSSNDQQILWKHAYNNGSKSDELWSLGAPNGATVGVKVDFDSSPMTIEYLFNNAQGDAVFGPWGIPAATYSPVLGVSSSAKTALLNVASIRLIETDFVYAIPVGYAAWSEGITADTDFTKFTESITDRVTGVTFDSTSVAAIAALVHSSPATAYTYAYYLDQSTTASKLMTWAMAGIGGYWFINRLGNVQVGQLTAPSTSSLTIDDVKITGDITIQPDNARALSNGIGSVRNWSPYRESEVSGSATEVFKQKISREYQTEYRSSTTMAGVYDHANGAPLPVSLLANATAAQTEADRLAALYTVERYFYRVPIALNAVSFDTIVDGIGNSYVIKSDRFKTDTGVRLVLVGVEGEFLKNEVMLTLWGAAAFGGITVLDFDGTAYDISLTMLDFDGTAYTLPAGFLSAEGVSYTLGIT